MTKKKLLFIFICLPFLTFSQTKPLAENKKSIKWLQKNYHPLEVGATDFSFLHDYIEEKRIVFLGEETHGIKELERVRVDIIKYLIDKEGFDVILFENDMDALAYSNYYKNKMTPKQMLSNLYPVWQSEDLLDLMTFVKAKEDVEIAGFDNKLMSSYRETFMTKNIAEGFAQVVSDGVKLAFNMNEVIPDYEKERTNVMKSFQNFLDNLDESDEYYKIKKRIIQSNIELVEKAQPGEFFGVYRDSLMAGNLKWLLNELYPDKKIIVWAANIHIMPCKNDDLRPELYYTGEVLFKNTSIRDQSYVLFTDYWSGSSSMFPQAIVSPPKSYAGVERLFNKMYENPFFIDLASQEITKGNQWMGEEVDIFPITTFSQGMTKRLTDMTLVPKDCFDGLIYFRKVTPSVLVDVEN